MSNRPELTKRGRTVPVAPDADRMQAPMTATGYSGMPQARMLGFKSSTRALVVDAPLECAGLFEQLPLGAVDVKVCAVNAVWTGLRLVVRKELRAASGTP